MRPAMLLTLCATLLTACGKEPLPPPPQVIQPVPPEVITRCPDDPLPPVLPALPTGATVPRATVLTRDIATGRYLGGLLRVTATCRANSVALRSFFNFDKPVTPAPVPLRPPSR